MKKINCLSLVALFLFCSCGKINNMDNKYEWLILTTSDMGYPMKIRTGAFYDLENIEIAGIPADMNLKGQWWDGNSGIMIAGDQYRSIPSKMKISWFSYAEDKFYSGDFNLDYKKLYRIFKKGLKCDEGNDNYKYIKIAIAPKGQVFLYLVGGNTILIGSFAAKEYFVNDFKSEMGYTVDENRKKYLSDYIDEMPLQTQKEIANNNISTEIWKDITRRYPWKYSLEAEEFEHIELKMQEEKKGAIFISGEQSNCTDVDYFTKPSPKPIPLEIDGLFKTSAGRTFTIRIYPGNVGVLEADKQEYAVRRAREQELVKLFKDFYEKIGKQDFEIHLRMDDHFKTGKVFLKKGNLEQEIPNTEVQIFDDTFGE